MVKSRFGYRTSVPSLSSQKGQSRQISFKDGRNTYKANDDLKPTELLEAIDARFTRIGRYKTRRGSDRYSTPVGEALSGQNAATTGPGLFVVNGKQALAQRLTATRAERLTGADVRIRSTSTSAGVLLVEVYANDGGKLGGLLARSSIRPADITSTLTYKQVFFIAAPAVTLNQQVWVVVRGQNKNVGNYEVSTTTTATNPMLTTLDYGTTDFSTAPGSANVRLYSAPTDPVKGVVKVYRPNGELGTFFAANTRIYKVNESTGATTVVKDGLNAEASVYRFQMVQDKLYFTNGLEKPYVIDLSTNETKQLLNCPIIPDDLLEHKGLIFYKDAEDKTKYAWTNFAEYDVFTSTDFGYAPAPKSYDSIRAFGKLNGVLFLFANRNKFQLMGSDNDTFQLDEAASQRGTFTQESLVFDANFIYHADDEGVWRFNGTDERNLAESFLEEYLAISDKKSIQLDIYKNRLYIFYRPAGAADNTECFVYNLLLDRAESKDVNVPVGRTFARYAQDDVFIQASNRVAALYLAEQTSNDFHNLGDQIHFELRTSYNHFDRPGDYKRIPKWRPTFASVKGDYAIQAGYAKDFEQTPAYVDVSLSGGGHRYNTGKRYNTGLRYSTTRNVEPTNLLIPGTFKRLQQRFQHIAAREPVEVDSVIASIETQRLA